MPQMAAMGPIADTVGPPGRVRIGRDQLRILVQTAAGRTGWVLI